MILKISLLIDCYDTLISRYPPTPALYLRLKMCRISRGPTSWFLHLFVQTLMLAKVPGGLINNKQVLLEHGNVYYSGVANPFMALGLAVLATN